MTKHIRLAFIGAGRVNFGGGEGPWDHASRFENITGIECVGVADIDEPRARDVIQTRQSGANPTVWKNAQAFGSWRQMAEQVCPDAVVIGLPPACHGHRRGEHAIEATLAKRGIAMFIEKPLSVVDPYEVEKIADALRRHGVIVSVGYMFRYARSVNMLRDLLQQLGATPNVVLARYNCAYSGIDRSQWWDVRRSGGPIVEQGTHFLDLARYIGGEVDLDSIQVTKIGPGDERGQLRNLPVGTNATPVDCDIPVEHRADRATLAQWRFTNGAIGSLSHGVQLHGSRYETELEVWADGVRGIIRNLYDPQCHLEVRHNGEKQMRSEIRDDDPYAAEDAAFIEAVRSRNATLIRSNYDDALRTYRLSWQVGRRSNTFGHQTPITDVENAD